MVFCRLLMALTLLGPASFAADVNIRKKTLICFILILDHFFLNYTCTPQFDLVWINDKTNDIAAEAIEVGLNEPPAGVKVSGRETMSSDTTEVVTAIEQLCGKLGTMIDANTPPGNVSARPT